MYYITVKQSPAYKQMSMEDFLYGDVAPDLLITPNTTNTRTYAVDRISKKFIDAVDVDKLIGVLEDFNRRHAALMEQARRDLYIHFNIPKKSGGLRPIDQPVPELMDALRELGRIFELNFGALYHTSAYAYIKGRSHLDAVKRHQANASKWFLKLDTHNFFGTTTVEFVLHMLSMIYPFCLVMQRTRGYAALKKAVELGFLSNVLPQGTPLSPMLTNIIMIPVDYTLYNTLRDFNKQAFVYTRYADDLTISSKFDFHFRDVEQLVKDVYRQFQAPYQLNEEKTRYGSSAGRNWNLGLMLTKDNQITVGHRNKKQFQNMLTAYAKDKLKGVAWDKHDVMVMEGLRNYYRMVEGETIDRLVQFVNEKYHVNLVQMIKRDLKPA